jgi:cyclopropane fatty-acyl-phospholipid synthase-like methyltransferase
VSGPNKGESLLILADLYKAAKRITFRVLYPGSGRDWDVWYKGEDAGSLPWFIPELDADMAAAIDNYKIPKGKALDIGTGPGTQAIALAKAGFTVTGVDISQSAIELAAKRANEENLNVNFQKFNVINENIDHKFDLVIDRGCFHTFADGQREKYIAKTAGMTALGGYLLLKCFSTKQKEGRGPRQYSPEDIRSLFSRYFEIVSIDETVFQGTIDPNPRALFCVMRKKS